MVDLAMLTETNLSYASEPAALVVSESEAVEARQALALGGFRVRHRIGFTDAISSLHEAEGVDVIVIEAVAAPEALVEAVLARVDAIGRERDVAVIANVAVNQIDLAAAQLTGPSVQLLSEPSEGERLAAAIMARRPARGRLHDATRDGEADRLQRLNEEVARIAETLARLTRGEDAPRAAGVRDPGRGYRGGPDEPAHEASPQEIRAVIRSRRLRSQFFTGELFADPAWDMLLDLFASELENRRVSVSSLCIAAAVPPTTALRWIGTLHDAGLFERQADPADRRRAYIGLSSKGLDGMRSYIAAAKRQGLGLV